MSLLGKSSNGRDGLLLKYPSLVDGLSSGEAETIYRKRCLGLSRKYAVIILDEANIATFCVFFSVEDLLDLIRQEPEETEIIITGRNADRRIVEGADLVTEVKETKHYYQNGVEGFDPLCERR